MSGHSILTIGVSADGLEALKTIVGNLLADFPAAVFIVRHIGAGRRSMCFFVRRPMPTGQRWWV